MTGGLAVNYNTATASVMITNTGGGAALQTAGAIQAGSNTGTDGYDVNFYGTFSGFTGGDVWDASKDAFRAGQDGAGNGATQIQARSLSLRAAIQKRAATIRLHWDINQSRAAITRPRLWRHNRERRLLNRQWATTHPRAAT